MNIFLETGGPILQAKIRLLIDSEKYREGQMKSTYKGLKRNEIEYENQWMVFY